MVSISSQPWTCFLLLILNELVSKQCCQLKMCQTVAGKHLWNRGSRVSSSPISSKPIKRLDWIAMQTASPNFLPVAPRSKVAQFCGLAAALATLISFQVTIHTPWYLWHWHYSGHDTILKFIVYQPWRYNERTIALQLQCFLCRTKEPGFSFIYHRAEWVTVCLGRTVMFSSLVLRIWLKSVWIGMG